MNTLMDAWTSEGRTDNGMKTNITSNSSCMDFFFLAGASRGKDITVPFIKALSENEDVAIRTLLWLRDIRGGAGERQTFRTLIKELINKSPEKAVDLIPLTVEVGRWDDLLEFIGTALETYAVEAIRKALTEGNGLAAKWMPRKGDKAVRLRNALGWTPKQYRKTLVELTKVVETQMCDNRWGDINYEHVPSVAASRYQAAFARHDEDRYKAYRDSLVKGEAKINASAIFPHDIVKACRAGGMVANQQWLALPNYMGKTEERILPVCDVSGSMNGLPMDVSVALGLYISERNEGVFKDVVCTFSANPNMVRLQTKSLRDRIREIEHIEWDSNTDLNKVFQKLLAVARQHSVPEHQMPTMLLIISDMEFDQCIRHDDNAIQMIERTYTEHGYKLPKVVFWNVNGREGNVPVRMHKTGTALISGFSPAILQGLLSSPGDFTPYNVMMNTVMVDRYKWK